MNTVRVPLTARHPHSGFQTCEHRSRTYVYPSLPGIHTARFTLVNISHVHRTIERIISLFHYLRRLYIYFFFLFFFLIVRSFNARQSHRGFHTCEHHSRSPNQRTNRLFIPLPSSIFFFNHSIVRSLPGTHTAVPPL